MENLAAACAFVKADPDQDYRRLCAHTLTDVAIVLLVGALFSSHAAADASRKALARHWQDSRMPDLRRHRDRICSGIRLALSAFDTLAGPAMEIEAKPLCATLA